MSHIRLSARNEGRFFPLFNVKFYCVLTFKSSEKAAQLSGFFVFDEGEGVTNDNLIKGKNTQFKSGAEAAENGRKGGIASGKSKRQKKLFKQLMNSYLESEESNLDNWNELSMAGFEPEEITNKAVIIKRLVDQAKTGDVQAVKLVLSIVGEDVQHEELKLKQKDQKLKEKQSELNNW